MKKRVKWFSVVAAIGMTIGSLGFTACGGGDDEEEKADENKTQLYVANYTGGVGSEWLEKLETRFEEKYKDVSFENGKKGVQIMAQSDKKYTSGTLLNTIKTDTFEVYFTQGIDLYSWASLGLMHDLTDLVNRVNPDDNKKIIDKFYEKDKENMAVDGKYYTLPHNSFYHGISYDAGVFESKKFYFSDQMDDDETYPGTRAFVINKASQKSPGPDGKTGTYDDGLPSSVMEFNKLIDHMSQNNCDPFIWSGDSYHYANMLIGSMWANLAGIDGYSANFLFDSNGKEVEIVTGWNGNTPKTEKVVISTEADNGYLARKSVGLYYAVEFAAKVFGNSEYYQDGCTSTTVTNISAMSKYMFSGLNGSDPVGFIIDGSYWYNEAVQDGIMERLASAYSETYDSKKIRFMPMPRQYAGTVQEGQYSSPVLYGSFNSCAIINGNIKPEKVELAELFLQYCYSDEALVNFTLETNGNLKGVQYDYASVKDQLPEFAQSVLEMYDDATKNGSYVKVGATNGIFKNNYELFSMETIGGGFTSTIGTQKYAHLYNAVNQGRTAKEYFEGMGISEETWNSYDIYK